MRNAYLQDAGAPTVLPSDDTIASAWSSSPLGDPAADINRPTVSHYDVQQPVGAPASMWSRSKTPLIVALIGALGAGAALGAVLLDDTSSPSHPQTTAVVPGAIVRSAAAPAMVAPDLNAAVPPGADGLPPAVDPAPASAPPALSPAVDSGPPAIATMPVPDDGTSPADLGPPPPPDAGPPPPPPVFVPPVVMPGPLVIVNAPGPQWGPPLPPPPAPHVLPPPPPPHVPLHFTPVPAPPPHVVPVTLPPLPPHLTPVPVCKAPTHLVNGHCV